MQLGRVGGQTAPGESPEWTFVVGRGFLVVVPVSTPTPVVAALHGLAAESVVPIEDLVALIPLGGLDDVDSFAVIVPGLPPETARATDGPPHDGIPVHALVRGALAVDVFSIGGSRRFTDRNIRPWLLAEFQAVTGLVIGSPLAAVARTHQLGAGRVLGEGIDAGDTLFWSVAGRGAGAADTVLRPRRIVDDTVLLTRTGDPDERRAAAPLGGSANDAAVIHDRTADSRTVDSSADPDAAPPGPCGFRLATGREARLDRVYRIGRNPRTRRIPAGEILELVTVDSPNALVSGNHLEIRQTGTAVVLTDLGSTNGTLVRFALGRTQRLRSGASLTVLPGTTVDIGDGNLIEILPAG
ncbi:FHA domain-containing protein [Cryobacterium arcticum]|uniref:FHA domain-containing protein n=1 Tax=Cryobacterium arcticum TaxID=670052 RepID=A0A1B1BGX2_9MICO|nr:FHA domain-containing protein [Cryobacterium arcticum]ANP71810.1 hypothetical protein PA27867_0843 [Cryobacterium arcticum]